MAGLIQGLKNFKANLGTATSELQHLANQLQGAGGDEKRFLEAVYEGKPQVAAALLSANPNVIYARTKEMHNAWHIAAQQGSLPMLEVLHTHGRGATRKPLPGEPPHFAARTREKRETPLMLACANNHLTAMQYLLGVGASARDSDKYGNTILHYAALNGQVKILSLLLASDEGLQVQPSEKPSTRLIDVRNEAGLQPLHFAVWGCQEEACQVLFEHYPDLVAKSITDSMAQVTCNGGSTPLHVAALKNSPPMVDLLLQEYVRVTLEGRGSRSDPRTVTDNYHFTPFQIAKDLKREAVLPLIDPIHTLKGLEPGAVAAAGVLRSQLSMRRSHVGTRSSNGREAAALAAVAGAAKEKEPDPFDGFAALAAGTAATTTKGSTPIPVLAPPPPPGAKAGKALASSIALLSPPPGSRISITSPTAPGRGTPTTSNHSTVGQSAPATPTTTAPASFTRTPTAAADSSTPADSAAAGSSALSAAQAGIVQAAGTEIHGEEVPEQFLCPITKQVMAHPVIAGDGRAYEADAIQMWLTLGNEVFPGGVSKVASTAVEPAQKLREEIAQWKESRKA